MDIHGKYGFPMIFSSFYIKPKIINNPMSKNDFSKMGLPGVENVPRPRRSILRPTRASQLSYNAKIYFKNIIVDFPFYSPY